MFEFFAAKRDEGCVASALGLTRFWRSKVSSSAIDLVGRGGEPRKLLASEDVNRNKHGTSESCGRPESSSFVSGGH